MIHKRPSGIANKVVVTFELPGSLWAECINLVGDFNHWDHASLPFWRDHQGNWRLEVELDAGREYRFRYLLDGEHWRYDWHADKSSPNSGGGYDSIVTANLSAASR